MVVAMRGLKSKLFSLILLVGCGFNTPPNTQIATLDSFPEPRDTSVIIWRLKSANAATIAKIDKVDRDENYEDLCAITCKMRGGDEPNRFYTARIDVDSILIDHHIEYKKTEYIAWGIPPKDWMPGKGLSALFLIRKHCWEEFGFERVARGEAGSFYKCDIMWSLVDRSDVLRLTWWQFILRHENLLGTEAEY